MSPYKSQKIVEIKARCQNPDKIRQILKSKGAEYKGLDHQIDIYFKVNSGRLKLREGNIENHLIFYQRDNHPGPKESNVLLFKTEPDSILKSILTEALGLRVVVEKKREIYFIKNVKFHINDVKNLGTFVEIEAIGNHESAKKDDLNEQCRYYLDIFEIQEKELIKYSYSDLLA